MATQDTLDQARNQAADTAQQARDTATAAARQARDEAAGATQQAREQAAAMAKQAQEKAEELARRAQQKAGELGDMAGDYVSDRLEETRQSADETLRRRREEAENLLKSISDAIDAGSDSLREDGYRATASIVHSAAEAIRSVAGNVHEVQPESYTRRAERFARENPMITMSALALAGFSVAAVLQRRG